MAGTAAGCRRWNRRVRRLSRLPRLVAVDDVTRQQRSNGTPAVHVVDKRTQAPGGRRDVHHAMAQRLVRDGLQGTVEQAKIRKPADFRRFANGALHRDLCCSTRSKGAVSLRRLSVADETNYVVYSSTLISDLGDKSEMVSTAPP